ncbi:MAG: HEAT repeat domain-containing protein [Candidatus Freyarchaeota archaeon]
MTEDDFELVGKLLIENRLDEAFSKLLSLFSDENFETRASAVWVVDSSAERFPQMVEKFLPRILFLALSDESTFVRANAMEVLGLLSLRFPEHLRKLTPVILESLESTDIDYVWNTILVLGWIGGWIGSSNPELVRDFIPDLVKLAEDDPLVYVRSNATEALVSIAHKQPEIIENFVSDIALISVKDPDSLVRGSAEEALILLTKEKVELVPEIVASIFRVVEEEGEDVSWNAVLSLGWLGTSNSKTIDVILTNLRELLNSDNEEVRGTATLSIGWIVGNNPKEAQPFLEELTQDLMKLLDDENATIRKKGVEALGWIIGNSPQIAATIIPKIKSMASMDEDKAVRERAESTLRFISNNIRQPG